MTDSPDYRKYLEQKFSGLTTTMNAQFYEVHGRLDSIEKQTIKTNGRVNDLEKWKEGHVKGRLSVEIQKGDEHILKEFQKLVPCRA